LLTVFIFARDVGGNALFLSERAFPIFVATVRPESSHRLDAATSANISGWF
jgi:hypothetical protein